MAAIGMMDAGYFVGRKEVVDWINETLKLNVSKVEQTASGAVACQLLDRIYPGKVPLHKVNWDAKQDYEFINNYKILQNCFTKLKIDKHIDVEKLVRAKYQDNLEFMQWFKRFYEINNPALDYDPVAQRAGSKGANTLPRGSTPSKTSSRSTLPLQSSAKKSSSRSNRSLDDKENAINKAAEQGMRSAAAAPGGRSADAATKKKSAPSSSSYGRQAAAESKVAAVQDEALLHKIEGLGQENAQLQATIEGLEKERDFYFEKLTVVEELLQERQASGESSELIDLIFKILYATGESPSTSGPAALGDEEMVELLPEA